MIGAPLMFNLAYVYFLQFLAVILVSEKELRIKDHMLIMGLRELAYWCLITSLFAVLFLTRGSTLYTLELLMFCPSVKVNLFASTPVAATGFQTMAAYSTCRRDGLRVSQTYAAA